MSTNHDTIDFADALAVFEPVLGLETHVELGTNSKMFCSCPTAFGADANTQVCPVCLGLPGSLPVVNRVAVESTIRMGLALNCRIVPWCRFARKNYFYPDMPKDYQISQYDEPLCIDGYLDVTVETDDGPREFRVEIERVHMEEDTGKLTHAGGATGRIHGADYSLVDYNRAGIPLIEIVTKPIVGTGALGPQVAKAYVAELRDLMRALGVSDVRMEEGSLRCDVNVSLNRPGEPWGTRSETKNVNSLRSVERAVHSEIERQAHVLTSGGRVIQETRHFHEDTGRSTSGRSKEQAEDYRYFPEPDLVPVAPTLEWIEELRGTLPELPSVKRARLQRRVGDRGPRVPDAGQLRGRRARRGHHRRGRRPGGGAQVVDRRARPDRERPRHGARRRARDARRRSVASRRSWPTAASTTSSRARSSTGSSPARATSTRWWPGAAWPSSATTPPCWPRSTRRSPRSRTSPRRSAAARCRRPARSSAPS